MVYALQAIKVLNMVKLFGKPIRVNKSSQDKKSLEVGANLFVGNLDPDVDEKILYDTFSAFGVISSTPKIMRDPDTGVWQQAFWMYSRSQ
jgi:splicing factor 3B subunit 4